MKDLDELLVPVEKPDWYDDSLVPWRSMLAVIRDSNEWNMTRKRLLRKLRGEEDALDLEFERLKNGHEYKAFSLEQHLP